MLAIAVDRGKLVEANGKEITSVLYYPRAYGESDEELDEETIAEGK